MLVDLYPGYSTVQLLGLRAQVGEQPQGPADTQDLGFSTLDSGGSCLLWEAPS